jgi:unsaturated rhamnogalacturonyl hydrolase
MSPRCTILARAALFLLPLSLFAAPNDPLATAERVARWQLAHPSSQPPTGWVQGAFYAGLSALDGAEPGGWVHAALLRIGDENGWKPASRVYDTDDLCVGQMYLEMYLRDRAPRMIGPVRARCDYILAHPKEGGLEFVGPERKFRWSWCDSLFMGPPTWARLSAATHDRAYLDFAILHWWKTSDYLYDPAERLFFRDSTYFGKREKNGSRVFWSRGNGWVLAGLARLLDYLPANDPSRPRFERQFCDLAARVAALQQPDGFWRTSLLDPGSFPSKESSGTGFFCFGLAWGINHGLLDAATYRPVVDKAWAALTQCVLPDGELTYVQPIGEKPAPLSAESTAAYGTGAFLLSATQICRFPAP